MPFNEKYNKGILEMYTTVNNRPIYIPIQDLTLEDLRKSYNRYHRHSPTNDVLMSICLVLGKEIKKRKDEERRPGRNS